MRLFNFVIVSSERVKMGFSSVRLELLAFAFNCNNNSSLSITFISKYMHNYVTSTISTQ